jgi:hypothetical protein
MIPKRQVITHKSRLRLPNDDRVKIRKESNYQFLLHELEEKQILTLLLSMSQNQSYILFFDIQNIYNTFYPEMSFKHRSRKIMDFMSLPMDDQEWMGEIESYVRECLDNELLVEKIIRAIRKQKVYYVFITQKDLGTPESWMEIMNQNDHSILIGVACKDPETGMDCHLNPTELKENPMDDYVLLLLQTCFLIVFDSFDYQHNAQLRSMIEKINEMEDNVPMFMSQKFIQSMYSLKGRLKKLRTVKNPIPIAIDVSFDLRRDWIIKKKI